MILKIIFIKKKNFKIFFSNFVRDNLIGKFFFKKNFLEFTQKMKIELKKTINLIYSKKYLIKI